MKLPIKCLIRNAAQQLLMLNLKKEYCVTDPDHGIAFTFKSYGTSIAKNIAVNIRRIFENSDPDVDEIDDWVTTHFKVIIRYY